MPYHMIGARNMESAILGGYVDHVMELHPTAPLPGVYLADEIFKNAKQHRQRAGRREVLRATEPGSQQHRAAADSGWGKLAKGWDAARFDARRLEADTPAASDERSRLVGRPGRRTSSRPSRGSPRERMKPTSISTWDCRSSVPTPSRSVTTG